MIDAHHHLWRIGRPECLWPTPAEGSIYRDHEIAEYRVLAADAGVRRSILVQSQESSEDTRWLLDVAEVEPLIGGVVGWADLAAPDAQSVVGALAAGPKLVGLRPMVQDRAAGWYDDPALEPAWQAMLRHGLRLDALVRVPHLASLGRLARRYPELQIVVDHAAKPRIGKAEGFGAWYPEIARVAEFPNVSCKLSGLLTECLPDRRRPEIIAPYVAALVDLFGPQRLMWGSDWPVLDLAGDFHSWLMMARQLVPQPAHPAVFELTACRFYGLDSEGAAA